MHGWIVHSKINNMHLENSELSFHTDFNVFVVIHKIFCTLQIFVKYISDI